MYSKYSIWFGEKSFLIMRLCGICRWLTEWQNDRMIETLFIQANTGRDLGQIINKHNQVFRPKSALHMRPGSMLCYFQNEWRSCQNDHAYRWIRVWNELVFKGMGHGHWRTMAVTGEDDSFYLGPARQNQDGFLRSCINNSWMNAWETSNICPHSCGFSGP